MAKNDYYKGVTLQYKGDDTLLSAALANIDKNMREVAGTASKLNQALKIKPDDLGTVADKAKALERQVELAAERVDTLRQALEQQGGSGDETLIGRITTQLHDAEAKLYDFEKKLADVRVEADKLSGDGIAGMAKRFEEAGEALTGVGKGAADVGDSLTKGLTVPLAAVAAASTTAAVGIDTALTDVRKTVDGTEEDYRRLHDAAIEFSKTNAVSADQMLSIEALGAQLGFGIEELEEFGKVASGLDIATNMDAETAATNMAQFANVTDMTKDEISNYASTVVDLGNHMATTESDISNMAQRLASAGTQAGMSSADILGLAAALASVGMDAEAGGSAISTVMTKIGTSVAKGGDDLEAWAEVANMTAEQFASDWQGDPVHALSEVLAGLQDASEAGGNMAVMLEDLGIKELRQSDAMRRLAGNSDAVSEAVRMANDAWESNTALTDEVANRNESLESKMQMLQNRVTAVLEQVGKPLADALLGIVDAADPLFEAVENLASGFADLPDSMQQTVVMLGSVAAASGPVLSAWGRIVEGVGKTTGAFGTFATGLSELSAALEAGMSDTEAFEYAFEGMMGKVDALSKATAITLVITLVADLVGQLTTYVEAEREFESATQGLHDAVLATGSAWEDASDDAGDAVRTLEEIRSASRELTEAQRDLAGSITDAKDAVAKDSSLLDGYLDTIDELSGKSSLTAGEQALLADAVDGFNDITGASISIIDAQTGKLDENREAIRNVADAYKEYAKTQATLEAYGKVQEQIVENQIEIKRLEEELASADKGVGLYIGDFAVFSDFGGVADRYHELEKSLEQAEKRSEELEFAQGELQSQIGETSMTAQDYAKVIKGTGDATESAAGDVSDAAKEATEDVSDAAEEAADAVTDATTVAKRAIDDAVEAAKRANDEVYTATSRKLEDDLTALKDADSSAISELKDRYDKEADLLADSLEEQASQQERAYKEAYDLRKSELDQQAKLLSDSLSAELDALSDALSEAYDLRKSELDAEVSAVRTALGKEVSQQREANSKTIDGLKSEHSAEEAELKKTLDAQYKERSKAASKEAKLWQKANQQRLKEAKAAQDSETKAFKAATDARIAQIKREADAKKQAISDSDGTSEIDAQIRAIKEGQEATAKARKNKEREDKTAELRAAVEAAKTVRSKQDAQQALKEWLVQLDQELYDEEQEMRLADLEAEKAARAEETAAKQEAVDAERDAEIARYEEERQTALDAMSERHSAEYEALSEQLSEDLELRKEKQSEELEAYREQLDGQVTAMAEAHQQMRDQLAEQQAAEIEAMTEANSARIQQMQDANAAELKEMSERNKAEVEDRKASNAAILEDACQRNADELAELSETNTAAMEQIRQHNADAVQSYKDSTADIVSDQQARNKEAETELQRHNQDVLTKLRNDQSDAVTQLKRDLDDGKKYVDTTTGQVKTAVQTTSTKTTSDTKDATEKVKGYVENAKTKLTGIVKNAKETLLGDVDAAAKGSEQKAKTGAENVEKNVKEPIGKLPEWARATSNKIPDGLANGMGNTAYLNQRVGEIETTIEKVDKSGDASSWGWDLIDNLVTGIYEGGKSLLGSALDWVATTIQDAIGHSVPKEGPLHEGGRGEVVWGEHLVENLVQGIESRVPLVAQSMAEVADAVAGSINLDAAREDLEREMAELRRAQRRELDGLKVEQAAELAEAMRSGATDDELDRLRERYGRAVAVMEHYHDLRLSEFERDGLRRIEETSADEFERGEEIVANISSGLESQLPAVVVAMDEVSAAINEGLDTDPLLARAKTVHEELLVELRATTSDVGMLMDEGVAMMRERANMLSVTIGDGYRRSLDDLVSSLSVIDDRLAQSRGRLSGATAGPASITVNVNIDKVALSGSRSDIRRVSRDLAAETARNISYTIGGAA